MKKAVKKTDATAPKAATLRKRAEEIARETADQSQENIDKISPAKIKKTLHELRVHQVELEIQNEELQRTQMQLDAQRERYFDLYDLAPIGYVTVSEQGVILEGNLTAVTMLGVTRKMLLRQPLTSFIIKEDQNIYYRHCKELFETGKPQKCELRMVKNGETYFWAHLEASAAQDNEGSTACRIVLSDITDRKRAEEAQAFLLHCGLPASGEDFFESLARYLAKTLGMDYVCIDQLEGDGLTAQTVAVYNNGKFESNVSYALKDTPCGEVVGKGVCCYPRGVRQLFPRDLALQELKAESYFGTTLVDSKGRQIGLIAVIGHHVLDDQKWPEALLKMVAPRAAGELERRRAENELRKREYLLNKIFDVLPIGLWFADENGKLLRGNPVGVKIWGAEPNVPMEEYGVFKARRLPSGEDIAPDDWALAHTIKEGVTVHDELLEIDAFDGLKRVILNYTAPVLDDKGILLGAIVVNNDITERKRAEDALRRKEHDLRESQRIAHVGSWRLDVATNQVVWTEELYNMYGFDPSLPPPHYTEHMKLFTPESWERLSNALARTRDTGIPYSLELETVRKDGSNGWMWVRGEADVDSAGKTVGLWGAAQDITARKQAEEEKRELEERLTRSEKMESLGLLAGGVAHDLNNVLGIVVGYAELVLDAIDEKSPLRKDLKTIFDGGQKAAAIVEDLLTLARRGVVGKKVLNLNKLIGDFKKSPQWEKLLTYNPHVNISTDLDPDLLNIAASSVHLEKTLYNLVSNAGEAMTKGGKITIKTSNKYIDKPIHGYDTINEGDYVVLSVSDEGDGISETDLKRIFEPFYTKKIMGRSGTGLGLSVVWGTVKDHQGYIDVQSEEGKGTTFSLYFLITREDIEEDSLAVSMSEYLGNGQTLLIVDDVKDQRDLAARLLTSLNYKVSSVPSGEEAIKYLKDHQPDLIVLDMIMDPGMDGLDTYKSVLEINPKQKAIIVSGFSESDRVKEAKVLGAGAYIKKPYIKEKLGLAVKKELERAA